MMPNLHLLMILLVGGLLSYPQISSGRSLLVREKRQASFLLPTDTETFLSQPIKPQFRCLKTGYYADIDNNCQMYHVCVVQTKATGHKVTRQFSFVCGNGTIFNQLTQTCDNPEESLPCIDAPKFYGLNSRIGQADAIMHTGNDYAELIDREKEPEEDFAGREDHYEAAADSSHSISAEEPGLYFYRDEYEAAADTLHSISADKPGVYYYKRPAPKQTVLFSG